LPFIPTTPISPYDSPELWLTTPVGSGTVARTKRIPVEQRAEAAVIAWLRHQTTGYDGMVIPRVKGKRREVRRMLARCSHQLLDGYCRGQPVPEGCPLQRALGVGSSGQGDVPKPDNSFADSTTRSPHVGS